VRIEILICDKIRLHSYIQKNKSFCQEKTISGLSPKFIVLSLLERRGFLATKKPLDLRGTAGALRILSCQTPLHSPASKDLESRKRSGPVHDTHAAGVVTQATKNIAVAFKTPCARVPLLYPILSLRSCRFPVFYALILGKVLKTIYSMFLF